MADIIEVANVDNKYLLVEIIVYKTGIFLGLSSIQTAENLSVSQIFKKQLCCVNHSFFEIKKQIQIL